MNPFIIFLFVLSITQIIVTVGQGYVFFVFLTLQRAFIFHVNHSKDFLHILHNERGQLVRPRICYFFQKSSFSGSALRIFLRIFHIGRHHEVHENYISGFSEKIIQGK